MEENKKQTANVQQTVECSKCHKQVTSTDGVQKTKGFVCNDCCKKQKKRLIMGTIGGVAVVAAIAVGMTMGNKQRTGEGFGGIGEVKDSMSVSVSTNNVDVNLSTKTAVSSSVSTQNPISNLEAFKHELAQNIDNANKNNATDLVIPSVSPLFEINTNIFADNSGEALINEFASAYAKTNKKATILVEGYTCDLGGTALNNKLSEVRAKAVKDLLVTAGVPENKIEIKWYGKSRFKDFKYSDKSEYRRVVLSIK